MIYYKGMEWLVKASRRWGDNQRSKCRKPRVTEAWRDLGKGGASEHRRQSRQAAASLGLGCQVGGCTLREGLSGRDLDRFGGFCPEQSRTREAPSFSHFQLSICP